MLAIIFGQESERFLDKLKAGHIRDQWTLIKAKLIKPISGFNNWMDMLINNKQIVIDELIGNTLFIKTRNDRDTIRSQTQNIPSNSYLGHF